MRASGNALVVEPLQERLRHVAEGIVSNFQVLADFLAVHLDGVRSRSLEFGKVDKLHALAATVPVRGGGRRHREHRLAGLVDKFDVSAALEQREFLEVAGAVANLVDVGGRSERNTGHGEDGRCGQKPGFHDLLHRSGPTNINLPQKNKKRAFLPSKKRFLWETAR